MESVPTPGRGVLTKGSIRFLLTQTILWFRPFFFQEFSLYISHCLHFLQKSAPPIFQSTQKFRRTLCPILISFTSASSQGGPKNVIVAFWSGKATLKIQHHLYSTMTEQENAKNPENSFFNLLTCGSLEGGALKTPHKETSKGRM